MATLSLPQTAGCERVRPLDWRAVVGALRGNSLAAFPAEAFSEEVVVQSFLGRRHILLQRPAAIRHVLVDNPQNYARAAAVRRVLRPMFGQGLFLSAGEEWREQRRAVAPAFAPRIVAGLARRVVENADDLAVALADIDGPVELVSQLQRLAIDIIGGAVFSLDMARYAPELRTLIQRYAARLGRPTLGDFLLPLAVPTPRDVARTYFRRRWLNLIGRIIAERAARPRWPERPDLFDILAAPDPETGVAPDTERLGDQIATIVVAGHETTAAGLFWTLYLLAQHADIQSRMAAEVARIDLSPANATAALPQLAYTRAVVDEAVRLYPPAFVIVRQALADDLAGGIEVPAGALVLIAPFVLHRHRRFWTAPERFDPERFLPGAAPPRRFVYMPFGAGPRICVGAAFALTELILVVATLVRRFHFALMPHKPVQPLGMVTTQPDSPPPFVLRRRAVA